MRSQRIHRALAQGLNRYELCQLASKGVRATHKLGSRFEETINQALDYLGEPSHHARREPGGEEGEKIVKPAA